MDLNPKRCCVKKIHKNRIPTEKTLKVADITSTEELARPVFEPNHSDLFVDRILYNRLSSLFPMFRKKRVHEVCLSSLSSLPTVAGSSIC
jgi:hypothetical protein